MNKKTLITALVTLALLLLIVAPALAVKPAGNLAGAEEVPWHLSADVMPVPPYGSRDIPDSDTSSKLIVNQPNGNTEVTLTGVMKGLNPYTPYTVYLSKGYTPYVFTGWNVGGNYVINVKYLGVDYPEDLVLTQTGADITGVSIELVGGGSRWTITHGSVDGNNIDFYGFFDPNPGLKIHIWGTIAADGSMSGGWADVAPGLRTGTWATTSGSATKTHTGSTGWPGLFTSTVPSFTFATDENGNGSWHLNLRNEDFPGPGEYYLSVWINEAGKTILISDNFQVVVD